ncbi:MAG: ferrous iron transport protein B [Bacteroidales bacterium]|nr:ferrous iron transport protein B [Bacteroidales bacterium]
MTLKDIKCGHTAKIITVGGEGALRQHLLDMGLIPDVEVTVVKYAPMGDPIQVRLHGYELTLRLSEAEQLEVSLDKPQEAPPTLEIPRIEHPGLGEPHLSAAERANENPLPKGEILTFALVGNQNCGKTTLFNQLTGSNQHVGNFPGVTVDQKSGPLRGYADTVIVDLPGIYSLSPYTAEERVSRKYILEEHPKGLINIVDATNIERNLYLTMQLMELGIPMVLALNMMDEMEGNGGTVIINQMEAALGIPVVPISAAKNQGIEELIEHAMHVARYQEAPRRQDFCDPQDHGGAVHRCLHALMHLIEDHADKSGIPIRFAASKIAEGDVHIFESLQLDSNEQATVRHILRQLEQERGMDCAAAMAEMRFAFIKSLCRKCVVKPKRSREHVRSLRIDRILTGKFTAIPSFLLILSIIFWLTFQSLGAWLQGLVETGVDAITDLADLWLTQLNVNEAVHSLIIEGVFAGVGSVVSFLPFIVLLFFFLSMLEDSGYMARIAFVSDSLLRRIGLSGRSIVPMLIGFGCSVPSVMASRTLPSVRDRRLTILLTPFMSCTAKVAIYVYLARPFFGTNSWLVMIFLYALGITVGIFVAYIAKKCMKGEAVPFVMELPNYRLPSLRNTGMLLWEKSCDFLERAFTVIFVASIIIWFLQHFNFMLQMVEPTSTESILASVSNWVSPIFSPLGFGDWRTTVALISGFMAKESFVSTLDTLLAGVPITALFSKASALSILVFCLLYTPCVAAIAAIRRELGNRYALFTVCFQCTIAWIIAWAFYLAINLFMI